MKKTAILLNTARGGLINEEALFCALKKKNIAFAGLDVFVEEPLKKTSKLWQLENIIHHPPLCFQNQRMYRKNFKTGCRKYTRVF